MYSKTTGSNSSKLAYPPAAHCPFSMYVSHNDWQQQQQACLSTNTPCLDLTVPSASSKSLILHGPISHWHVRAVTQAFSWQAN